jgi:hypothetical protein
MHTHTFALEDAEQAILTLANRVAGEASTSVTIAPYE